MYRGDENGGFDFNSEQNLPNEPGANEKRNESGQQSPQNIYEPAERQANLPVPEKKSKQGGFAAFATLAKEKSTAAASAVKGGFNSVKQGITDKQAQRKAEKKQQADLERQKRRAERENAAPVSLSERPAPAEGRKTYTLPTIQESKIDAYGEGGPVEIKAAGAAKGGSSFEPHESKAQMQNTGNDFAVSAEPGFEAKQEGLPLPQAKNAKNTGGKKKRNKLKKGKLVKYIFLNMVKAGVFMLCMGIIAGCVVAVGVFSYVMAETTKAENNLDLNQIKLNYTSYILAQNPQTGDWEVYQELVGNENRIWVDFNQIPQSMIDALIATEDKKFYTHKGVDFIRTFRAGLNEMFDTEKGEFGASTVTQQVVKNITGDDEIDYMRKVREMIRALMLDKNYSKDMILEVYFNTMGLSENIAGVQAGAKEYFGKDVSELELWECAMIVGITKYPNKYSPTRNPEECLKRRNDVIYFMYLDGYITEAEADYAYEQPLGVIDKRDRTEEEKKAAATFSYFTDVVFEQVVADLQTQYSWSRSRAVQEVYTGGLQIYATVDLELQSQMEEMFYNGYEEDGYFLTAFTQYGDYAKQLTITEDILNGAGNKIGSQQVMPQMAVASVRNSDGSLAACIGGIGQKEGKLGLNRATQAYRQNGSTMKPIGPYSLAIDLGIVTYSTGIMDEPIRSKDVTKPKRNAETGEIIFDWPSNVTNSYRHYPVPIVGAITESINTVATRVGQSVGVLPIYEFLEDTLEFSELSPNDLDLGPMCLGSLTNGVTTYEMASAYTIFGNGGTYTSAHAYDKVLDANGSVILRPDLNSSQAISAETAFIMNKALATVINPTAPPGYSSSGTVYKLDNDVPCVGKTGTTSDDRDRWFVGVTPELSTAVWWGYDMKHTFTYENSNTLRWVRGRANVPGHVWKYIMDTYYEDREAGEFPEQPETVVEKRYCLATGYLAGPGCGSAVGYYNLEFEKDLIVCSGHTAEEPAA